MKFYCVFFAALTIVSCGRPDAVELSGYDQLCDIFQSFHHDGDLTALDRAEAIDAAIRDNLPEIYTNYEHLSYLPPAEVYPSLQALAKQQTGQEWECSAIEVYYQKQ